MEAGLGASKFAGHSFRTSAATTVVAYRVEDSLMKTLGHWESSAYLLHVHIPRERLAGLSTMLSSHVHTDADDYAYVAIHSCMAFVCYSRS